MDDEQRVWVKDRQWEKLQMPKICRFYGGYPRYRCHNKAEFALRRSNGLWAYCLEHMYGRRIRDGIVELEVAADSPTAKRGYIKCV